jgi:thiamine transporter ThiT
VTAIMNMLREMVGLIVDDGQFALSIAVVVALAASVSLVPGAALAAGGLLLLGCLGVLILNVITAAQR